MSEFVDIVFNIGVLLNLIKGADLLLLDKQKEKIQDRFESFTIIMDDKKPMKWFALLRTKKFRKITMALNVAAIIIFAIYYLSYYVSDILADPDVSYENANVVYWVSILIWAVLTPIIFIINNKVNTWILSSDNVSKFLLRVLAYISIFALGLLLLSTVFGFAVYYSVGGPDAENLSFDREIMVFELVVAFMLPFLVIDAGTYAVYGTVLLMTVGQYLINILLKVIKGVLWRIAEYDKGAYAAIILIVTIGLGILKVFV